MVKGFASIIVSYEELIAVDNILIEFSSDYVTVQRKDSTDAVGLWVRKQLCARQIAITGNFDALFGKVFEKHRIDDKTHELIGVALRDVISKHPN